MLSTYHAHTLYSQVFEHMDRVATTVAAKGLNFKLREGYSAETSGTDMWGCGHVGCVVLLCSIANLLLCLLPSFSPSPSAQEACWCACHKKLLFHSAGRLK